MRLTSAKMVFNLSLESDATFCRLKTSFTSTPILQLPDPEQQLVVEVDALDVGVSMVLSETFPLDQRLRPCAFLPRRLTQG